MSSRAIPLSVHGAIEMFAAPAIMVAPFVLGFGLAATIVAVLLGAVLLALSLQVADGTSAISLSAHAELDFALAVGAAAGGLAIGVASGEWAAAVFLAGVGAAMVLLTASTRFSRVRGA